jgi:uncharacterized protein
MKTQDNMNETAVNYKQWSVLLHLSGFAMFLFPAFGNILAPLVLWILKKEQSPLIDEHGKEVLNFQISMTLYICISIPFVILLIGIPAIIVLGLTQIVCMIIAAIKADEGVLYRYPLTIRFIK